MIPDYDCVASRADGRLEYSYISEFHTGVGGVADVSSEKMLLRIHQPYTHGNGGPVSQIHFSQTSFTLLID